MGRAQEHSQHGHWEEAGPRPLRDRDIPNTHRAPEAGSASSAFCLGPEHHAGLFSSQGTGHLLSWVLRVGTCYARVRTGRDSGHPSSTTAMFRVLLLTAGPTFMPQLARCEVCQHC